MKILKSILFFLFLIFLNKGRAQDNIALNYSPELVSFENVFSDSKYQLNGGLITEGLFEVKKEEPKTSRLKWDLIEFKVCDLPTFCRIEVQMEKATKIPVKFRLGEVQYVERLEGKY